jgi:hypothetical protein
MTGFFLKKLVNIPLLIFFLLPSNFFLSQSISDNNPELSFVVYSKNAFYGLNLDNSAGEIRFRIETQNQHRVLFVDQFKRDAYQTVAAVNDQGTFVSYFFFNEQITQISPTNFTEKFGSLLFDQTSIPTAENIHLLSKSLLINNSSQVFADENQKGYIIRTINGNSEILENQNSLINSGFDLELQTDSSINDFYHPFQQKKRVEDEINKRISEFSIQDGFVVLESAQPRQDLMASAVFDPENNLIYLAFDKDFSKIWLINLDGETIETFSGFERYHKGNIPKIGITANDLRILNFSNEGLMVRIIIGAIGILIIILAAVSVHIKYKKIFQ